MTRPTDAIRGAVRASLAGVADPGPQPLAIVACSGGADSLALAAGTAQAVAAVGWRAAAVVVDHQLQAGSAAVAARAAQQCRDLGLYPVLVEAVDVVANGGPEAAARAARYAALARVAEALPARAVLLAHTLDDQAETVLLGLARGSGARSLQGMPARCVVPGAPTAELLRPLLGITREVTQRACAAWQLQPWHDPHNRDPRYARVRVRADALPALSAALGPGVPQALARTADLLRDDEELLSALAGQLLASLPLPLRCVDLAAQPPSLRRRVLRQLALQRGCPPAAVTASHIYALDAAVIAGRGGAEVRLPGGVTAVTRYGRLDFVKAPTAGQE